MPSLASSPSRALIACLLPAALLASGCHKSPPPPPQASENTSDNAAAVTSGEVAPDAAPAGPAAGKIDRSHKGEAAPTLGFVDPDGKPVTLAAYAGAPVLLNLWATWCGPCVKELPTLDALAAKGGRLRVVELSQDLKADQAKAFFAARGFKAIRTSTDPKMAWLTGVGAATLPTSILYDSHGKELWRVIGDLDWTGMAATEALTEAE